jgi:hypothetical protein
MRTTAVLVRLVLPAIAVVVAGCGPRVIRRDVPPPGAPPEVALPALGDPPPAPACLDAPVPVLDGSGGRVVTDGERVVRIGDDGESIVVAWKWGGPAAVLARAPDGTSIDDLAAGEGHVYWSISAPTTDFGNCILSPVGAIYRVPITGGKVETLVTDAGAPSHLAVSNGRLYWLDHGLCPADPKRPRPRWVERLDLAGRARAHVLDDDGLNGLAVEGDVVTVITGSDVARSDRFGGSYHVLGTVPGVSSLAVKRGRTFVTTYPDTGQPALVELPVAGGAPRELAVLGAAATILVDDDTVYAQVQGAVWAVPMAGGNPEVVDDGVALAAIDGDRLLAWGGRALYSIPRTQRRGTIVATGIIGATSMTSDATTLYWGDRYGGMWSVPLAGGPARKLTRGDTGAEHHIALVGDRLVFTSDGMDFHGPGAVGSIPKTGGAVTWIAEDLDQPLTLAVDGTDVLVGDGRGVITRYPVGGGVPAKLTSSGSAVTALATDGARIYFARSNDYTIFAMDRKGGAATAVGRPSSEARDLLVDGGDLVVATYLDGIERIATTGGTARPIAHTADVPTRLALDATHLYWVSTEAIERIPRAGGRKERVASGAAAFAITGDAIYASTYGVVSRAAKPAGGAALGRVEQAAEPEMKPLAVVGDTVYVATRTDVRALDLATSDFPVVAAPHRTASWVGADARAVYFLADERIWAIELAALPKRKAEMLAVQPNATARELGFDTDFIEPLSQTRITAAFDLELVGDAVVWTTGDSIRRMRTRGGEVDTLVSGLPGADWLAHDANRLYVTAKNTDGAGWAVYAVGAAGTAPTRLAALAAQPRGLVVGPTGVVVSTETTVLRVPRAGGTPTVVADWQRGAGPVAVRDATIYWLTRDGLMVSDATTCSPRLIATWPSDAGPLRAASLAATADGAVFSDPVSGVLVTAPR